MTEFEKQFKKEFLGTEKEVVSRDALAPCATTPKAKELPSEMPDRDLDCIEASPFIGDDLGIWNERKKR